MFVLFGYYYFVAILILPRTPLFQTQSLRETSFQPIKLNRLGTNPANLAEQTDIVQESLWTFYKKSLLKHQNILTLLPPWETKK